MAKTDTALELEGFSLTTAEILYHLPDYPALLQSYVWQEYDLHPRYPKLSGFLEFWSRNLEGKLSRVLVTRKGLLTPREVRLVAGQLRLN